MTRTVHRTLLVAALAGATAIPSAALAQSARTPEPAGDALPQADRDALAAADQLASDAGQVLDQWIISQASTEDKLFARLYFPIPKTDPQKYNSPYDSLADRDLIGPEDKALSRSSALMYAIVTDINGYVPAHNTKFAKPMSGNTAQDYTDNRTKRIFGDPASFAAARFERNASSGNRYLIQRVVLETGDVIYDLSVPVTVRGKHWGCARVGYRRSE
jgi:methyl-accepting chemotaxis protein